MSSFDPLFAIIIVFFSAIVHEVAHGYAALFQGDVTAKYEGRLTLNPLVHIDFVGSILVPAVLALIGGPLFGWAKPVPYNPYNLRNKRWGEALVAAAGPATNIIIAIVFGLIIRSGMVTSVSALYLMAYIIFINVVLALFNLMPIPPLDGSKILYALIPAKYGHIRGFFETHSFITLIIFIIFLWQYITPLIFFFFQLIVGLPLTALLGM